MAESADVAYVGIDVAKRSLEVAVEPQGLRVLAMMPQAGRN